MTLAVRGVDYKVAVEGDPARKRAVVLLHGFAGSAEDWRSVAALLQGAGFATVAVDLVGHGGTSAPLDPSRYTMHETVLDLAAILDALSIDRADWLGYSMGGRVALHFALAYPARVRSLILESASPGIAETSEREARRRSDETLAARIEERGIGWFADHWASLPIFETQARLPAEVRASLHARRLRNDAGGLARSLCGMGQGAQEYAGGNLARLMCPVLLIAGDLDAKYVQIAHALHHSIPDSQCSVIPRAGHNVHLEAPEAFGKALVDHLNATETRTIPEASSRS